MSVSRKIALKDIITAQGSIPADVNFAAPSSYIQPILDLNYAQLMTLYGTTAVPIETFARSGTLSFNNKLLQIASAATGVPAFEYQASASGGVYPVGYKNGGSDQLSITGLSSWLPSAFTILVDCWVPDALSGNGPCLSLNSGSVANRIEMARTSSFQSSFIVQTSGSVVANQSLGAVDQWYGGRRRLVISCSANNFIYSDNGEFNGASYSGNVPSVNRLDIGWSSYNTSYYTGDILRVTIYAGAMTPAQVCALAGGSRPQVAWGDSLTFGTGATGSLVGFQGCYPQILSRQLMPAVGVSNQGVGGQTSTQIAVRQGGVKTTLASSATIPTSGNVSITFPTGYEPVTASSPFGVVGTLAGVLGTVTYSASVWTFTPSIYPGSPVSAAIGTQFVPAPFDYPNRTSVFWTGRNNFYFPNQVLSDTSGMVSNLTHDRFLVMSVLNGWDGTENAGSAAYNAIIYLNNQLSAAYPNNYLDIRSLIVAASGGANDAPNPSWGSIPAGSPHLNNTGYAYVGQQVYLWLSNKNWI